VKYRRVSKQDIQATSEASSPTENSSNKKFLNFPLY
jgi:hypothetical protein